ncbi:hypothetical protein Q8W71_29580 [Methylobacterium sp. NEAU 140]|uniref:hypothetical protein n=1 Tax=Methylobacterium sp. NEAU 140 TaxID=3064945 RepID=UPI002733DFB0|nr:hypothetical protein [Methylobacterium sp. NEAU 140]MDP4026761.1 hypothetical protein [Methylobacterium sp. NEAU 140]
MPNRNPIVRRTIRAETTAVETLIMAERMRALGAWSAYFTLIAAVSAQRERAARTGKQIAADWAAV